MYKALIVRTKSPVLHFSADNSFFLENSVILFNKQNKFEQYTRESTIDSIIDFFLFSTTIQAGVGISEILPISVYGKILMIIQQLIMISISVITIYVFTK